MRTYLVATAMICSFMIVDASAKEFKYRKKTSLRIGQSIVLKGVRSGSCGDKAPTWAQVRGRLPRSKTGSFSNGGTGTVNSSSCGGKVGARGIRFTAKKRGKERLRIFKDYIRITVK